MKRYDGLFILNSVGHEDNVGSMIEGVSACIVEAGGKVNSIESMDTKTFARVANRKYRSGHYFTMIFELSTEGLAKVQEALRDDENVFRSSICRASKRTFVKPKPSAEESDSKKAEDHVSV